MKSSGELPKNGGEPPKSGHKQLSRSARLWRAWLVMTFVLLGFVGYYTYYAVRFDPNRLPEIEETTTSADGVQFLDLDRDDRAEFAVVDPNEAELRKSRGPIAGDKFSVQLWSLDSLP